MKVLSKGLLVSTGVISLGMIGWAATNVDAGAHSGTAMFSVHQCSYCHSLHGGAGGPSLTLNADVEVLCQTCHGPAGSSALKAEVHTNAYERRPEYDPYSFTCTNCHNPHDSMTNWLGGTNIRLVGIDVDGSGIARIATPNSGIREVVYESRGTNEGEPSLHSMADGDEDGNGYYDGICETCHTQTVNHQNETPGAAGGSSHTHNRGKTCTACHDHATYFIR